MNMTYPAGLRVMLSAGLPDELKGTPRAQRLYDVLVVLSRALAAAGARLVFGGHPTITPVIDQAVSALVVGRDFTRLYQAAYFRAQVLQEVLDPTRFPDVHWIGDPAAGYQASLTAMRQAMVEDARAAILIGGRSARSGTPVPGLREEHKLFLKVHPEGPVYLLGLLDGEARRMIGEVERGGLREPNGLTAGERHVVHHSDLIELVAPLIIRDLGRHLNYP